MNQNKIITNITEEKEVTDILHISPFQPVEFKIPYLNT